MDSIKTNPEEAQQAQDETNPEEVREEEDDTNPEEEQLDPIERHYQNQQVLINAQKTFVQHRIDQIKKHVKTPMSEEDREYYDWIIREQYYYFTIESYERTRKTDKSDGVAERLYKAMCKAYDDYDASRKDAIWYREKVMCESDSFIWWGGPL